jgi:hypothetical protein
MSSPLVQKRYQGPQETDANTQSRITDFNVAVSVLSMFVLLVKCSMFILHVWFPILSTVANLPIVVLWAISVYGQMGPDHSDPRYPSNIAWYISKSCSYAPPSAHGYCMQAKGAFAVSVFMLYVFLILYPIHPKPKTRKTNPFPPPEQPSSSTSPSEFGPSYPPLPNALPESTASTTCKQSTPHSQTTQTENGK